MNDTGAGDLAITIMSFMAFVLPLAFMLPALTWGNKKLGDMYKGMKNGVQRAGNRAANTASNAGKRLAKNSAPGQAVQEYMNTRRASAKVKGQELYRRAGRAMPFLNYSQTQKQLFDAQNMKNYQEEVSRARGMTSLNVARAFGNVGSNASGRYNPNEGLGGQNLERIKNDKGYWSYNPETGKESFIAFTQEDMNSLDRLNTAGFLKGSNNRAGATAALDELFDQQFVEKRDIENLSRTAGTDAESSALMTNTIRSAAGRNKYKNYMYGQVENGKYSKYVESPKTKDDVSIVESGTAGVPKEVYEDYGIQAGIAHRVKVAAASGDQQTINNTLTDIARQTSDVNKPAIIKQIAQAAGMDEKDFVTLRQAIQTNSLASAPAQSALSTASTQLVADNLRGFRNAEVKKAAKEILTKRVNAFNKDTSNVGAANDVLDVRYFSSL